MQLTKREKEVLKMLCLPNPEIAKRLFISLPTVKRHVHNISNKFPEISSRRTLLVEAVKRGIIKLEDVITK